ncbi:hypothetical protein Ptr902_01073 [Pyrenophora tritici-repentis]|nr:hypothetical protein Ptr902_01073 [Pyrenophora tritici-repentis]
MVRLVKPHTFITAKIEAFDNASGGQEESRYSLTNSKAILTSNWFWEDPKQQFSEKVIALIAILSEATPGHHGILMDLIIKVKDERIINPPEGLPQNPDVQEKDVKIAVRRLYSMAPGGIGSVWPGEKAQEEIERNDIDKAKKAKKVKAPDEEVEALRSRLGDTSLPDTMVTDGKDEQPVVQPGK